MSNTAEGFVWGSDCTFLQTGLQNLKLLINATFIDTLHMMTFKEHNFDHNLKRPGIPGCPIALIRDQKYKQHRCIFSTRLSGLKDSTLNS